MFSKGELVYEGKAKKAFTIPNQDENLWFSFKDSLTAFNAQKTGSFEGKGKTNLAITEIIFKELHRKGIPTHWVEKVSDTDLIVKKLNMIPLEVVIRNVLAGSTAKKFQIKDGTPIDEPLYELFYKHDDLGDPFINDSQALMLKTVPGQKNLDDIKVMALKINDVLLNIFAEIGILLVDFKIEFGYTPQGQLCLGDEISPDSCRLWEKGSDRVLDKDRFRKDLGDVKESYEEVLSRLKEKFGH